MNSHIRKVLYSIKKNVFLHLEYILIITYRHISYEYLYTNQSTGVENMICASIIL